MKKNVGISYKAFAVILAAVLILGGAIGGTMAWLIDGTEAVANVFTDSDINITLVEEAKSKPDAFKMIPGHTITKDPKVTVISGSEDCYLFVKIDKSENYSTYLADYTIVEGWTSLKGHEGVYYREVGTSDTDQTFSLLAAGSYGKEGEGDGVFTWKENQVLVLPSVTKADMEKIKNNPNDRPTLTFTAYAVQLYKTNVGDDTARKFTPAEAWAKAGKLGNQTTTPEA